MSCQRRHEKARSPKLHALCTSIAVLFIALAGCVVAMHMWLYAKILRAVVIRGHIIARRFEGSRCTAVGKGNTISVPDILGCCSMRWW